MGCSPWGREESDTTEQLHFHFSLSCMGEGNGNPLQCSCPENPRVGEPGGLPSMGSHRVWHDWSDLAAAATEYNRAISSYYKEIIPCPFNRLIKCKGRTTKCLLSSECSYPLKINILNTITLCHWRYGLWEIIRSWRWGLPEMHFCSYKRDPRGLPYLFM